MPTASPKVAIDLESKLSDALYAKGVAICERSEYKNLECVTSVPVLIVQREDALAKNFKRYLPAWRNTQLLTGVPFFAETRVQFWGGNADGCFGYEFVSWSLPAVLDRQGGLKSVVHSPSNPSIQHKNVSPQLSLRGLSADHNLPKSEESKKASYSYEPPSKTRKVAGVSGNEALIYGLLIVGVIFEIAGLGILESGGALLGGLLAGFGFLLFVYSGLAAIGGNVAEHFQR
jgi:hypothetical protein